MQPSTAARVRRHRRAFEARGRAGSVGRPVDQLTAQQPALQLPPQQAALSLGALHEAAVLLGAAGQVGDDLVHGPVGNVLVDWESSLACLRQETGNQRLTSATFIIPNPYLQLISFPINRGRLGEAEP